MVAVCSRYRRFGCNNTPDQGRDRSVEGATLNDAVVPFSAGITSSLPVDIHAAPGDKPHPLAHGELVHTDDCRLEQAPLLVSGTPYAQIWCESSTIRWPRITKWGGLDMQHLNLSTVLRAALLQADEAEVGGLLVRLARVEPQAAVRVIERGVRYAGRPRRRVAREIAPLLTQEAIAALLDDPSREVRTAVMLALRQGRRPDSTKPKQADRRRP